MQEEIILRGINVADLLAKIDVLIEARIAKSTGNYRNDHLSPKYFSRKEVAKLLKISLPTLHQWTKLKMLQSYKIGNRVLYKQEEVEGAVAQVNNIKYKKNRL